MKTKKFLTKEEAKMTEEEFDQAMEKLIAKGLMEELVSGGEKCYRITDLGRTVYPHVCSNPEERN